MANCVTPVSDTVGLPLPLNATVPAKAALNEHTTVAANIEGARSMARRVRRKELGRDIEIFVLYLPVESALQSFGRRTFICQRNDSLLRYPIIFLWSIAVVSDLAFFQLQRSRGLMYKILERILSRSNDPQR